MQISLHTFTFPLFKPAVTHDMTIIQHVLFHNLSLQEKRRMEHFRAAAGKKLHFKNTRIVLTSCFILSQYWQLLSGPLNANLAFQMKCFLNLLN